MKRHLVMVGLPGAGKSTVGQLVASRLGAGFVDLDAVIARRMQMPVTRIFGEFGEQKFRELEREAMQSVLDDEASVIAPGGGWVVQEGELERARDRAFIVYLKTLVTIAAERAGASGRPLLEGDPLERMRQLMKEREPWYTRADLEVKNDHRPAEAAADEIVQAARTRAGW